MINPQRVSLGRRASFLYFLFLLFFPLFCLNAHLDDEKIENSQNNEPLFVSLGSTCQTGHFLRNAGLRKAAYPFDWLVSLDGEGLIQILDTDFSHFLDKEFLVLDEDKFERGFIVLLHTLYHMEFIHEGTKKIIPILDREMMNAKFHRRIERFREIKNHKEKVVFIRASYSGSLLDDHRIYKFKENLEISEEYSFRLFNSLKKYFPDLDFSLLIVNLNDQLNFEKKCLGEDLYVIKWNFDTDRITDWKVILSEIIKSELK